MLDDRSRRWLRGLRAHGHRHEETVAQLHSILLRIAEYEVRRRRPWLWAVSGPELDDLALQAADDAVMNVLRKLDEFRGASRFTTWAYKFVVFEVSSKLRRHLWHRSSVVRSDQFWLDISAGSMAEPESQVELREQLKLLSVAVDRDLTERQREVFVAVALNEVPVELVARRLGSNRNAVYKNLHDARRNLRARLGTAVAERPVRSS
jgi:RNA polymerase sigma-70 factor (ECF subfamily)